MPLGGARRRERGWRLGLARDNPKCGYDKKMKSFHGGATFQPNGKIVKQKEMLLQVMIRKEGIIGCPLCNGRLYFSFGGLLVWAGATGGL